MQMRVQDTDAGGHENTEADGNATRTNKHVPFAGFAGQCAMWPAAACSFAPLSSTHAHTTPLAPLIALQPAISNWRTQLWHHVHVQPHPHPLVVLRAPRRNLLMVFFRCAMHQVEAMQASMRKPQTEKELAACSKVRAARRVCAVPQAGTNCSCSCGCGVLHLRLWGLACHTLAEGMLPVPPSPVWCVQVWMWGEGDAGWPGGARHAQGHVSAHWGERWRGGGCV